MNTGGQHISTFYRGLCLWRDAHFQWLGKLADQVADASHVFQNARAYIKYRSCLKRAASTSRKRVLVTWSKNELIRYPLPATTVDSFQQSLRTFQVKFIACAGWLYYTDWAILVALWSRPAMTSPVIIYQQVASAPLSLTHDMVVLSLIPFSVYAMFLGGKPHPM